MVPRESRLQSIRFFGRYAKRYTGWILVAVVSIPLYGVSSAAIVALIEPIFSDVLLAGDAAPAGFAGVSVERVERDLVFDGGIEHAHRFLDASPIGPVLRELSEEKSAAFRARFDAESEPRTRDGVTRGAMASLVLTAGR